LRRCAGFFAQVRHVPVSLLRQWGKTPDGFGFRLVKMTYLWDEDGMEKTDVQVARTPEDTINGDSKPTMKNILLELAAQ
jgi:hypothetical protein